MLPMAVTSPQTKGEQDEQEIHDQLDSGQG